MDSRDSSGIEVRYELTIHHYPLQKPKLLTPPCPPGYRTAKAPRQPCNACWIPVGEKRWEAVLNGVAVVAVLVVTVLGTDVSLYHEAMSQWTTIGSSCLRRRPESDWIGQSLRTMPCGRYKDYYLDTVQVGLAPTTGESMWEPPVSRTGMNMLELMVTYADLLAFWFSFFLKHMRRESHETWTFYKHLQASFFIAHCGRCGRLTTAATRCTTGVLAQLQVWISAEKRGWTTNLRSL